MKHSILLSHSGPTYGWGEMGPLSLRNNHFKFKTLGKSLTISKESIENYQKDNRKISTCNQLDSETLRSHLIFYQNLSGHDWSYFLIQLNFLVGSWLFCIQSFSCSISFWCMLGVHVQFEQTFSISGLGGFRVRVGLQ